MNTQAQRTDVYQIITNRIIEQLAQKVVPWRKPWTEAGHPQNLITKLPYRGINTWLLGSLGYAQNYFLTVRQATAIGATIKKGEHGHMVTFWKRQEKTQDQAQHTSEKEYISVLRYYVVFNIDQCENIPETLHTPATEAVHTPITLCDEIVARMPQCPAIVHGKGGAWYDADKDEIHLPKQGSFTSSESYYCTLFHELIHSTGHQSRLNRKEIVEPTSFGSEKYGIEELTAEIGACYLNSVAGIIDKEFDSNVAYIKSWIEALRNDKRMIFYASGRAQKAVNFILNVPHKQEADEVLVQEGAETP
ncbi:MAG TPA: zincin-like metallopeptidase domain-containing protein [Mucilaginibacter sp.]|nr:zincin-like metallopeptidase domain-containing protein [Mucilaginibacter sp.]